MTIMLTLFSHIIYQKLDTEGQADAYWPLSTVSVMSPLYFGAADAMKAGPTYYRAFTRELM